MFNFSFHVSAEFHERLSKIDKLKNRYEILTVVMLPPEGEEEKGMTEDEMVGWHHQLDRHMFEQAPGIGDGQGSLACCSPWGSEESDMTK